MRNAHNRLKVHGCKYGLFILMVVLIGSVLLASPISGAQSPQGIEIYYLVGLLDMTIGMNEISGQIEPIADGDQYEKGLYVDGRIAFFLKGKIKGKYLVTAQMDTGEVSLTNMFDQNIWRSAPGLFRQLDPEAYYPVYGDDSRMSTEIHTWGKLYLLVQWDQNELLWGTYQATLNDWMLFSYNRTLYGLQSTFREGDDRLQAFLAEPGTLHAVDMIRSSGTSLYYLSHAQVIRGTEILKLQVRDRLSGEVVRVIPLEPGRDYTVDYFFGRVQLLRSLDNLITESYPFGQAGLSQEILLVAEYEYDARSENLKQVTRGVQLVKHAADPADLRLSYLDEVKNNGGHYNLYGIGLQYTYMEHAHLNLEWAGSRNHPGPINYSDFGGQDYVQLPAEEGSGLRNAYGVTLDVQLPQPTADLQHLKLTASYQSREKGFATPTEQAGSDTNVTRVLLEGESLDGTRFEAKWLRNDPASGKGVDYLSGMLGGNYAEDYTLTGMVRRLDILKDRKVEMTNILGGVQLDYHYDENTTLYLNQQIDLYRTGSVPRNNWTTAGVHVKRPEGEESRVEYSSGDLGDLIRMELDYRVDPQNTFFAAFETMADWKGGYTSSSRLGHHHRPSDELEMYIERKNVWGSYETGSVDVLGADYYPFKEMVVGMYFTRGRMERIQERPTDLYPLFSEDIFERPELDLPGISNRETLTFRGAYRTDTVNCMTQLQVGKTQQNTIQYLYRNSLYWQPEKSLTLKADLNGSLTVDSKDLANEKRDVEGNLAIAYRPIAVDDLHLLGKYTYKEELSPAKQVNGTDPDEKAHIFSIEGVYDLDPKLELAEKLAYKSASIRTDRANGDWYRSDTYLLVNRLGGKLDPDWKIYGEYRILWNTLAQDQKMGYLVGLDWDINNTTRLGIGYNFTDFNDDLTHLSYNAKGFFFTITNKW